MNRHIPANEQISDAVKLVQYAEHNASFSSEPLVVQAQNRNDTERSALDYLLISTENWKNGDYEKSLRNAYTGIAVKSDDKRIMACLELRLGTVFQDLGSEDRSWELAEKCFNDAINIDDSFQMSYICAGELQFDLEEFEDAEELYKKAKKIDATDPTIYNSLGYLYLEQDRNKEAEQEFRTAENLEPELPIIHLHLATLFQEQGRSDEAVSEFKKAIDKYPENGLWYAHLGLLLIDIGRTDEAADIIKKAQKLSPASDAVIKAVAALKKAF
jgi:tetratricopeptide (TPR) repeat protein